MPRRRSAIASAAAILLAAGAAVRAQPANDLCANAQPITGFGTFHLDNQNAGLDGLPNVPCSPSLQINRDLWFCWTAPATTQVRLSTCLLTSVNTSVAGYDGCGCPAVSLVACDDDNCDPQSRVAWSATAGQTYLLRIGSRLGFTPGHRYLSLEEHLPHCYANGDNSTAPPFLNVNDFICFMNAYAFGCSAP